MVAAVAPALNQVAGPVEAVPLIESEHDNLTPDLGRACPARTAEVLGQLVRGGRFIPKVLHRVGAEPGIRKK